MSVVVPLIFPRVLELFTRSQTMRATLNHLPTEGGQSCSESHDTIRIWSRPRRLRAPPRSEPAEEPEILPLEEAQGES